MAGILLILFALSACAGFVQRVSGFGFGIFVMLFFPYIIKVHTSAVAVSTLVSCIMSLYNAVLHRKYIPYKKIIPLVLSALVTIPAAVCFSVTITADVFRRILGIVLILLSICFLFFNNRIKMKPSVKNGIIAGGMSGILTGLFSTGGPPVVLYLMNALSDNAVYFASTQFYFGITGVYSTAVRFFGGTVTFEVIVYSLVGFFGALIGNLAGKYVFDKLDAEKLRIIIYIGMIISGIIMVF